MPRRKRQPLPQVEGLESELIAAEMIDGLMPVNIVNELDEDDEAVKAIEKRRYDRARRYLNDGQWKVANDGLWVRSHKGHPLYFYVFRDSLKLAWPGRKRPVHLYRAFERLYMMLHTDGFEANELVKGRGKRTLFPLPDKEMLLPTQRAWLDNIPPSAETLRLMFGWDADWQVLFYVNPDRDIPEILPSRPFIKIDGVTYATARVISMLLYDNPHGGPDGTEKLASYPNIVGSELPLGNMLPPEKTKAKRPIRKRKLTPPKEKPFWRLKASEQARILLSKEPRK